MTLLGHFDVDQFYATLAKQFPSIQQLTLICYKEDADHQMEQYLTRDDVLKQHFATIPRVDLFIRAPEFYQIWNARTRGPAVLVQHYHS